MATRVLSPAIVPSTLVPDGFGPSKLQPGVTTVDIECGRFMFLDGNGKIQIYPLLETYFLDGDTPTNKPGIAYITTEKYHANLRFVDSVPFRHLDIGVVPLVPGVAVEMNLYEDGQGGAGETLAQADLGDVVTFQRVTLGTEYVWCANKTNPTPQGQGNTAFITGTIVRLMDEVGTVNGRVLVTINNPYRYEPFGFESQRLLN